MIELTPSSMILTASVLYISYYMKYYGRKPQVYCKSGSKFSNFLKNHVTSLDAPYWSFFMVPGGRFQTILACFIPRKFDIDIHRENVRTKDGGQFTLAWCNRTKEGEQSKMVVFVSPGLTSTSHTGYVQLLIDKFVKDGYTCATIVNRGLESDLLTGRAYCASNICDMEVALDIVRKRHSDALILGVGISLGGLLMGRYLSVHGKQSKLDAAFLYSVPFDPVCGTASLEKWDNWLLYNIQLTKSLKALYERNKEQYAGIVDHDKVINSKSIRDFDTHLTSKVFGYETVDHYYRDSMVTGKRLQTIHIPTLCLTADDDAFVPVHSLPYEEMSTSEYLAMARTNGGGHVGHLCGVSPFTEPYYLQVVHEYARAVLLHSDQLPNPHSD